MLSRERRKPAGKRLTRGSLKTAVRVETALTGAEYRRLTALAASQGLSVSRLLHDIVLEHLRMDADNSRDD